MACSCSLSAAAAAARKDQRNLAALTLLAALSRAHGAAPIPTSSDADRPAPAGWGGALRLLADVDILFGEIVVGRFGGGRWSSGSAPMLMSASSRRGGDGAGADRAQGATGSSTTDRKICSTVSEGIGAAGDLTIVRPAAAAPPAGPSRSSRDASRRRSLNSPRQILRHPRAKG